MRLKSFTKQQLSQASRSAIASVLGQLPVQDGNVKRWLQKGQRYNDANMAQVLREDSQNGVIDNLALAQRIAAGIPSHVLDGWSCFGRSIHCLMRGDTRNAVHLGYYAELRAVLAITASEGIAIFNNQHFIVDERGIVSPLCSAEGKPVRSGTHKIIWPIYEFWRQQASAITLVTKIIQPGSRALQDWFASPELHDIYVTPNMKNWLGDWGLDLRRMNQDYVARNASSYGPSAIHDWKIMAEFQSVETVVQLWRAFEPTESSSFDEIDRWLLGRVLRTIFQGQTRRCQGSKPWRREFCQFVDQFLDANIDHHLIQLDRANWKRFLAETNGNESVSVFECAGRVSSVNNASFPVELLSRAGLLLRLASGVCSLHLAETGMTWDSLMFWLNDIGIRRGFWKPDAYPENSIDIWSDISEALEEIEEAQSRGVETGFHNSHPASLTYSLCKMEECERIGMWGFNVG